MHERDLVVLQETDSLSRWKEEQQCKGPYFFIPGIGRNKFTFSWLGNLRHLSVLFVWSERGQLLGCRRYFYVAPISIFYNDYPAFVLAKQWSNLFIFETGKFSVITAVTIGDLYNILNVRHTSVLWVSFDMWRRAPTETPVIIESQIWNIAFRSFAKGKAISPKEGWVGNWWILVSRRIQKWI